MDLITHFNIQEYSKQKLEYGNDDLIGKKIHYKSLIEFKGIVQKYDLRCDKYQIKIFEWIGKGYPHLYYYLSKKEMLAYSNII